MSANKTNDRFIRGSLFYLRPVEEEDYLNHYKNWVNDQAVTHFMWRGTFPTSKADVKEAFEKIRKSPSDIEFTIVDEKTNAPIGLVGLHEINHIYRSAEFRILIGNKEFWGKGIGTEALQLITAYGFHNIHLHRVSLGVNADNMAAVKSYEKAGFKIEGQLRQSIFKNGRFYDVYLMAILKNEYEKVVKTWSCKDKIQSRYQDLPS